MLLSQRRDLAASRQFFIRAQRAGTDLAEVIPIAPGLKRRSARILAAGHAFVHNLCRGHYEHATDIPARHQLRAAFG